MPDEDAEDRHPATINFWFTLITLTMALALSTSGQETVIIRHDKSSSNKDLTSLMQRHHQHQQQQQQESQRTDYGSEMDDYRPLTSSQYVNDTESLSKRHRQPHRRRRYPPSLLRDMSVRRSGKSKQEVAPEVSFPLPYERRRTSAAEAALFLQSSRTSMRGDKLLRSSKDALIVTKKSYLKKDWCKTEPLIQRVRDTGCFTRTVFNRFCYGQCNSFYIPKNAVPVPVSSSSSSSNSDLDLDQDQDQASASFKSCAFCKPKRFRWVTITLHCPGRNPPYKKKRIQRIKKCKCISEILQ